MIGKTFLINIMRIAVSGTACQGKTTFIKYFIKEWPMYSTPEKTYRDFISENNLPHSENTLKLLTSILSILNDSRPIENSFSKGIFGRNISFSSDLS